VADGAAEAVVGVADGPGVGVGEAAVDPQPVANMTTIEIAARVRAGAAIRAASPGRAGAGAGRKARAGRVARSGSIKRGMARIVARALEVAVSSSSAVLGIHRDCVTFGPRNCGTKPSEPSAPSSLPPTGGANWAGASGPPFPGGLDGAGPRQPSVQRGPIDGSGAHRPSVRRAGSSSPPAGTVETGSPPPRPAPSRRGRPQAPVQFRDMRLVRAAEDRRRRRSRPEGWAARVVHASRSGFARRDP